MLCTPAIHDFPITFAREAKRFIQSRSESVLWNYVDKRNTTHIKLLKYLGFKFLEEFLLDPINYPLLDLKNGSNNSKYCCSKAGSGILKPLVAQSQQQHRLEHRTRLLLISTNNVLRLEIKNTKMLNSCMLPNLVSIICK